MGDGSKKQQLYRLLAYAASIPKSNYPCSIRFLMNYYKLFLANRSRTAEECSLTMSIIIYRGNFSP